MAHQTPLHRVPDHLSDENALLVEPFASGLRPALQYLPADDESVLILGAGTIGLGWLVTHRFKLGEYDRAFKLLGHKGNSAILKAVFEFD